MTHINKKLGREKDQRLRVSTKPVHLFLHPIISISLSAVENEDQLACSFTSLLILKSCPPKQHRGLSIQKNNMLPQLMLKTNTP